MPTALPPAREMYRALVDRNAQYEGIFIAAVRTTGIFCRPTCPARKPLEANVDYFSTVGDALVAGYRPCLRCRPLEPDGQAPRWLAPLLHTIETRPEGRLTDADLRTMDLDPVRVRRWFRAHHDMTFHAYQRSRRLGRALGGLRNGADITRAAYDHGFASLSGFRDAFARLFGGPPGKTRRTKGMLVTRILTPLGPMLAGATDKGICLLEFTNRRALETQIGHALRRFEAVAAMGTNDHLRQLEAELHEYFGGTRKRFDVPLAIRGTPFQESVWRGLMTIPYGSTRSYAHPGGDPRTTPSGPRRGSRKRAEPNCYRRPMSQGRPKRRSPLWLWGRIATQAISVGSRAQPRWRDGRGPCRSPATIGRTRPSQTGATRTRRREAYRYVLTRAVDESVRRRYS